MSSEIRPARTAEELTACFPVMRELRPNLSGAAELVERVQRQFAQGYHLLAAWRADAVIGAAGYRMQENLIRLIRGRFCYVDDLVVTEPERRGRLGARLLDTVAVEARVAGCRRLTLDTALITCWGNVSASATGCCPPLCVSPWHWTDR
jgi:GNAT superfamily N-acetyltransferase